MSGSASTRDPWLRFVGIFAALAVVAELVYYGVALESPYFERYLELLAWASAGILDLLIDDVHRQGTRIAAPYFSVEIGRGCDAYRLCTLAGAAVIAFPATLRQKLWGLGLGFVYIHLLNFVRIIGLFFIGGLFRSQFQNSHEIYFPLFLVVMTVGGWMVWVRWANAAGAPPEAADAA